MKQQELNNSNMQQQEQENRKLTEQHTGTHSPDTKDAAENNIQESEYGTRSYAYPDFFKKKPKL